MRWAFFLTWLAFPAWAEPMVCAGANVTVNSSIPSYVDLTCQAVNDAAALFDQCSLPSLEDPLRIDIVNKMKPGCVAMYHCGTDRIELLEPPLMEARRSPRSAFTFLSNEDYFRSVVVHEVSHVLFDDVPCPFASCPATNEYFAYAMQVMSLTSVQQNTFLTNTALERKVSRDELSFMIFLMSPGRFAQKAWAHLSQQDDRCAYIRQILNGTVLLDYERF